MFVIQLVVATAVPMRGALKIAPFGGGVSCSGGGGSGGGGGKWFGLLGR